MFGLSKRQKAVLDAISSLQKQNGFCPSYAEIAARSGLKSKSAVHDAVRLLEARGYIRRIPGQSRSLQVIRVGS